VTIRKQYLIAFTVEAEDESDLPDPAGFLGGIEGGLPDAWFDTEEGEPFAISNMAIRASNPSLPPETPHLAGTCHAEPGCDGEIQDIFKVSDGDTIYECVYGHQSKEPF